jgi:hypothetical protein
MMKMLTTLVFVLAATTACKTKPADVPPTAGSATAPIGVAPTSDAAMGSATGSGSAVASMQGSGSGSGSAAAVIVPTEQDFEKKSKAKINDTNLENQVQALEKEYGK